jgi:hypothetical protein
MRCTILGGVIVKLIPLTQGQFAQVDDWNYDKLIKYKWIAVKGKGKNPTYYARRQIIRGNTVEMHVQILGLKRGERGDHKDGNGLNNLEANLRVCTHQQNMANRRSRIDSKYQIKGVRQTPGGRWRATISCDKQNFQLGTYDTLNEAALAYNDKAKELYGEFARLNEVI